MVQQHGRPAGAPLPQQPPPQQPPPQPQQQAPPLQSVLIGVAVQAAMYWPENDPDAPPWAREAREALQALFSAPSPRP